MNTLFADLSTGFSLYDIPVILVQCFLALLMAFILKRLYIKKMGSIGTRYFLPMSLLAVGAGIVSKTGLQGAVLGMGFLVLATAYSMAETAGSRFYLLAITLFSLLCGFSQVPLSGILFILFVVFLLLNTSE